ncbi:MAG: DUF1501 domain-containing protein [Phycisphaerales bacterium]
MLTPDPLAFTRRRFIRDGLTLASAALSIPYFLDSTALGLPMSAWGGSIPGVPEDRILVVVQLSGGNDGLNTVVPYSMPEYYRARPVIGIKEDRVLKLGKNNEVGLHPSLTGIKDLYDDGLCGIVQGVGYPNPNRSHFKSMDIWHTADTTGTGDGWLGRYFDSECCGFGKGESGRPEPMPQAGIAIGREAPLAMQGQVVKPIAFESADLFRWSGRGLGKDVSRGYDEIARAGGAEGVDPNSSAAFLTRTAMDAQVSSETIRKAVAAKARVTYPQQGDLGRNLQMIASMIAAGLKTRVYYASIGGFDTHAGQGGENGRHAQLLTQVGGALKAFYQDLKAQGNDGRVLTMTFSEFGRRVGQNGSAGTDHGTAAPLMVFGPMVKAGVLNPHPSLQDLDSGDLKYTQDFRGVYAGILSSWLKADPKKILNRDGGASGRAFEVVAKG